MDLLRRQPFQASDIIVGTATGNARMGEPMVDPVWTFHFLWWQSFLWSLLSFILVSMRLSILFSLNICHHSSIHINFYNQWILVPSFVTAVLFFFPNGGAAFVSSRFDYRNLHRRILKEPSLIKCYLKHIWSTMVHGPLMPQALLRGISFGRLVGCWFEWRPPRNPTSIAIARIWRAKV